MELLDYRMNDGSRRFWSTPEVWPFDVFCESLRHIPGFQVTGFVSDGVVEAWIDFTFSGFSFTINNQCSDWWYFSNDPNCPDEILLDVANLVSKC